MTRRFTRAEIARMAHAELVEAIEDGRLVISFAANPDGCFCGAPAAGLKPHEPAAPPQTVRFAADTGETWYGLFGVAASRPMKTYDVGTSFDLIVTSEVRI